MDARVVIVGAGVVGSSAALHLARLGWRDVVVVDKGDTVVNDGSTSHAPGGVVVLSHDKLLTDMAVYGRNLYAGLEPYSSDRRTFIPSTMMEVAVSDRRLADLRRLASEAKSFGVESDLVSPAEAAERLPYLDPTIVTGALHVPLGGFVAAPDLNGALQRDAAADGAVTFLPDTAVTDIETSGGRVSGVLTANPDVPRIDCELVLLCTNIWGPLLGDRLGVPVPLLAYEHQYVISEPLDALADVDVDDPEAEMTVPGIRELDATMYYRQHWDRYGIGSYWHPPRPVTADEVGRTAINPFTPDDFLGEPWERARRLFPFFEGLDPTTWDHKINGMFAFPVDGMPIVGESAVPGLWTATGSWLTHAGGVGKSVAEWMDTGETEWDMRAVDVRRFAPHQTTAAYVRRICNKNYREVYEVIHPAEPPSEPRDVRLSPFAPRLDDLDAEYTVFAGLELPNWFGANADLVDRYADRIPERKGWAAEFWSPIQGAEHLATRDGVGLVDLTGLSVFEVTGPDALAYVDHLCSNKMDVRPGRVTYTTWLTPGGGVARDLTVLRADTNHFTIFVGEGTRPRDLAWAQRTADGFDVHVVDASDATTALGLWGPQARAVLERVTGADVSHEGFGFFTGRHIDVGFAPALALRISYAGELGWELHVPTDAALVAWDTLWEAGEDLGLVAVGQGAFDSLRLEKGYRGWGTDIHTEYDPYESGLEWTVRLDKGDFVGAAACRELVQTPPTRRLSAMRLDNDAVALGYEPVLAGDNAVGYVTSSNFGYSVGFPIAYAYLPTALAAEGTALEVEYFGERYGATVVADPVFDPDMTRMRA